MLSPLSATRTLSSDLLTNSLLSSSTLRGSSLPRVLSLSSLSFLSSLLCYHPFRFSKRVLFCGSVDLVTYPSCPLSHFASIGLFKPGRFPDKAPACYFRRVLHT